MSLVNVAANFTEMVRVLERVAEALERLAPPLLEESVGEPPVEVDRAETDREAYDAYIRAKQNQGIEVDEWTLSITPRK